MSRRTPAVLVLGALAYLAWGPSFAGSAPKRQESAVVRMAGSSKWVNEKDPDMSHPSGLYVLPVKPAKKLPWPRFPTSSVPVGILLQ